MVIRLRRLLYGLLPFLWPSTTASWIGEDYEAHLTGQTGTGLAVRGFSPSDWAVCDYAKTFSNLHDLNEAISSRNSDSDTPMRYDCIAAHSLKALVMMLSEAHQNFTQVNDGYDEEFEYYVKYMKELVPAVLHNSFMFDTSNQDSHDPFPDLGPGMKFFHCSAGGLDFPCTDMTSTKNFVKVAEGTTKLTLKDKDGYHAALQKHGIEPEWVHFDDYLIDKTTNDGLSLEPTRFRFQFSGFPSKKDDMEVPNPKHIATKVVPHIPDLLVDMQATFLDMMLGDYTNGTLSDPAQAFSPPVFMLMQAVDNMAQAKALGKKEEDKEREALIMLIVSTVLAVVPFIGEEAAAAAGFATVARTIFIAGEAANGVLALYDSVKHPEDALLNVFGMIFGVAGVAKVLRNGAGLSKVAKARNSIKDDVFKAAGPIVKNQNNKLNTALTRTTNACKWL